MTDRRITYKKGYKYVLAEDFGIKIKIKPIIRIETQFIILETNGLLKIKKGYACDGPSGPTFDTKTFMRAAFVHDALYQLIREGYLSEEHREPADEELQRICLEDGMSSLRAWYVFKGVRVFGGSAATKEVKIYEAP